MKQAESEAERIAAHVCEGVSTTLYKRVMLVGKLLGTRFQVWAWWLLLLSRLLIRGWILGDSSGRCRRRGPCAGLPVTAACGGRGRVQRPK